VEQQDPQDLLARPARMETQDVMEILDLKEFRGQRENADPQAFLVSQE